MLATDVAVATLARTVKQGMDVHSGRLGPRAYYATETEYLEALLRSRLPRA